MWEVTFAHMHNEVVQGAGDIPPFVATDVSLTPTYSAAVHVFEKVKGTHPYSISLNNLMTNVDYYVRVTAHNERGFSLKSSVSTARTYGKPSAPLPPTMGIQSGTSLKIQWNLPASDGTIDEFVVERYSEVPTNEIQVITSSSTASLSEVQRLTVDADNNNIAGYFKLQFMGENTPNIKWDAPASGDNSVAQALAKLSTMGPAVVSRRESRRIVQGLTVSHPIGAHTYFTVVDGTQTDVAVADILWVWF